ncbi:MAG: NAD-dependent epimerase/dehydratase family protein [Alphaproteobacteria bacterium]|nr:NAD-dependent epimerase/dehydratase family protein [Alphaproteobacteria bacterium]
MKAAITGATGLVGANLAVALAERGHVVRCTRRSSSRIDHLAAFGFEWAEADLRDADALTRAFEGCEAVFHCAAVVDIHPKPTPLMQAVNVGGTANVLQAVRAAGVRRLVHCSSVVTVGVSEDGRPVDETAPFNHDRFGLDDGYVLTKREAEALVLAAEDVDAVVINPTYMFGPYDARPSSGRMIVEIAQGRIPFSSSGVNNFVDVRAVAAGAVAAFERGRRGERYILGDADMRYDEVMALIAEVLGVRGPRAVCPSWLAGAAGLAGDLAWRLTGKEPMIHGNTVRWGYAQGARYDSAKAIAELGYAPGAVREGVAAAVAWFRQVGMI